MLRGQLVARIISDANRVGRTISWQVRNILNASFTAALSLYYMLTMSPHLFFVALISMGIMAAVNVRYVLLIRPIYEKIRDQLGAITAVVTDNLNGFKTVRALGIEEYEIEKFEGENFKFFELNLKAAKIRAFYGNLSQLVLGSSLAAIVYFGGMSTMGWGNKHWGAHSLHLLHDVDHVADEGNGIHSELNAEGSCSREAHI